MIDTLLRDVTCTTLHRERDACPGGSLAPTVRTVSEAPRLEGALAARLAAGFGDRLDRRRLVAVLDRLGLRGQPPVTLSEAGRRAGLSGERVRQLESKIKKIFSEEDAPPPPPLLDVALATVARAAPIPAAAVASLLARAGVSEGPFSAESLLGAASLFELPLPFVVMSAGDRVAFLPQTARAASVHADLIELRARRQVERCGATTTALLATDMADQGVDVGSLQIEAVLEMRTALVDCGDGWFSFRDAGVAGAFVGASRRMLAVSSPLSVDSLHDGLRRHNAFRRLGDPAPPSVLAGVYRRDPRFVEEDGLVWSVEPVPETVIGPVDRAMIAILRRAPNGVLARSDLLDACYTAGLNLSSVNLYMTYSECLDRVGPALFVARGTAVAPPAQGREPRRPVRREDAPMIGWTADGRPWLASRVSTRMWANGVVHVAAALRPLLEGRRFACRGPDGAPLTTLGVDHTGNSWGWARFLRRVDAQPGSVVRATFDVGDCTAVLELVERMPPAVADRAG